MLRFIFTATAIVTGSSAIYIYIFHQRLSKRITHTAHNGTLPRKASIESIPDPIFTPEYFTIYDKCSKAAQRSCLPDASPDLLFTRLLRRNMTAFSHFPQALMLALASKTPEQKKSFKKAYISALDFDVGDLVCGVYRVVRRTRDQVEFEIRMQGLEFVEGRLVLSFYERENELVFCNETFMWRRADEARRMPLERKGIRWMHETAAWWLVDSGVKYLMDLE
jgi:hypothetical protein